MIAGVVLALSGSALVSLPAAAVGSGDEGCTPGYWKNHTENWQEADASTRLTDLPGADFAPVNTSTDATLLDALGYKGGAGLSGAERILLRAAAASWLNAVHDDLGFPWRRTRIVNVTNNAIESGKRARMINVAAQLDALNNSGCPLS